MNVEALRSLLTAAECGSFSVAAARLGVTQSTISARIQTLEKELGRPLFSRGRHGAELTIAGQELRQRGVQIVQAWDQARQQLALPDGYHGTFGIGGPVGLYDTIVMRWARWMKVDAPGIALRLDEGSSNMLCDHLSTGMIDAAIMYLPRRQQGLKVEELFEEQLVLTAHPSAAADWQSNYAFVDWGQEFRAEHARAFPDLPSPGVAIGLGALGLRYVQALEGAAYLPLRMVEGMIVAGDLVQVDAAPVFRRPVFLVQRSQPRDPALLDRALSGLRSILDASERP